MNKKKKKVNAFKLVIVGIVMILVITVAISVKNIVQLELQNRELKAQNEELTDKRDQLKVELENVDSKEYVEEQARRQLKLVNPDEILFIFPSDDKTTEDKE